MAPAIDLNRAAMFPDDRIDLRVWNDVDSDSGHRLNPDHRDHFPIDK